MCIQDIPGAGTGTIISKAVKNHDLAQKIRRDTTAPRPRIPQYDYNKNQEGDSLDRFKQETGSRKPYNPRRDFISQIQLAHPMKTENPTSYKNELREATPDYVPRARLHASMILNENDTFKNK